MKNLEDQYNSQLTKLQEQIDQLEGKSSKSKSNPLFKMNLKNLPDLILEYTEIERELKVKQAVYQMMSQEYEKLKIKESESIPYYQVLDRALPSENPEPTIKRIIVALTFFASLSLSIFIVFLFEGFKKEKERLKKE